MEHMGFHKRRGLDDVVHILVVDGDFCQVHLSIMEGTWIFHILSDVKRNHVFAFIKEQLSKRIQSWKNKLLSWARKEVLIKTMAQAILVYSMSVFLLPHNSYDDLKKLMNFFWWGSGVDRRKSHWES
ncbi:hypothetical protein PVK06_044861 [Gossypium arboreum]|uniref:Uncharacterized protein n=1 Tax=Gossypium arboreum TaxID=29729 RepID=A0ABR0MSE2_GOSAR|nr:hypothetical protein PVK06_044861 [Gossypium arboreum]